MEKAREFQKSIYFCFIDYAKAFDCVDHNKLENSERWEYQTTWPASWEICMQVKKQQLELDMEQQTGSKLGKEYIKTAYCHLAYLTQMQNTSWEMLDWMKHKQEEISITSDMQMIPPLSHGEEELKSLLMKVKEESEKAGLRLNIQKAKIMASSPITSWQINGKQWKQWQTLFSWFPKSLQMVTAAMKRRLLLGRKAVTNLDIT